MKSLIIPLLLSIFLTMVSFFLGLLYSIETPVKTTENLALLWAIVLNTFWFIPYLFFCKRRNLKQSILLFSFSILFPLLSRLYTPDFDSKTWKRSINLNRTYGGIPAYSRGEMVQDLIESEILLGKSLYQIETIIGKNHFLQQNSDSNIIWYFYQSRSFIDGCDKIYVEFNNEVCTKAGIGGCD